MSVCILRAKMCASWLAKGVVVERGGAAGDAAAAAADWLASHTPNFAQRTVAATVAMDPWVGRIAAVRCGAARWLPHKLRPDLEPTDREVSKEAAVASAAAAGFLMQRRTCRTPTTATTARDASVRVRLCF
ncbi:hypothetical protein PLESTB_001671700 [Pleodorina starrii]|uniref:Uncharacterized protein n=1 Tax=Pleodorina starrii TaxID=330485 RepID=A0A9W6F916_9CHLO|nr:hypothetical protein PLESTM_000623000 [Pleodorina starrii]GLC60793.1 hypothetical protein PLESTB_001671700 [Pleodorina starrii]GLC75511.1 hypothetical protein PLESTF_001646000 [Pleodorina starrii]